MKIKLIMFLMVTCFASIATADENLSCLISDARPGDFYIYSAHRNGRIGGYYPDSVSCLLVLRSVKKGKLCAASEARDGQFYFLDISTNGKVGGYFDSLSSCLLNLKFQ